MRIDEIDVQCTGCGDVIQAQAPENQKKYRLGFAAALGVIGWFIGSGIGMATAGIGASAAGPIMLVGVVIGLKIGQWYAEQEDGWRCPECDEILHANRPEDYTKYRVGFATSLGILGWGIGSVIGTFTAGLGTATSGPITLIFVYVGLKTGEWYAGRKSTQN